MYIYVLSLFWLFIYLCPCYLDISWMKKPAPIYLRSLVQRPALADAVDYSVDVKSHESVHDHDDVFVGKVISINKELNTICVLFEGDSGEVGDREEFDYHSPDIAWMQAKEIKGGDLSPKESDHPADSTGVKVKATPPSPVKVQVHSAVTPIKVHSPVPTEPVPSSAAPIAGKSPVVPISKDRAVPGPLHTPAVPAPLLVHAVGYQVSCHSKDIDNSNTVSDNSAVNGNTAVNGNLVVGVVRAVDSLRNKIFIRFNENNGGSGGREGGRGGSGGLKQGSEHGCGDIRENTDIEFDYESSLINWLETPKDSLLTRSKVRVV